MKKIHFFSSIILALVFFSCTIQPIHRGDVKKEPRIVKKSMGHGPPPHAPAHGYRHKHRHGVELRYDSGLGVYVVIEIPGMYFNDGLYIQCSSKGYWEVGYHYKGPWRIAVGNEIPAKLDQKKGKGKQGKAKGKGHYKVKKQK
jgi:hypothetical protein